MDAKIVRRIEEQLGLRGVVAALAQLPPSDLRTLQLELSRVRVAEKAPATLLSEWERNRFVRPSAQPPMRIVSAEEAYYLSLPPEAEALTLSPVAPLGTCASVATVSQHKVVSAERGTEVVADPTNVLALECAMRRRALLREDARSKTAISLATTHRAIRAQQFEGPGLAPHFGVTAFCTAGRDEGRFGFEFAALRAHLGTLARWVKALDPAASLEFRVTPLDGGPDEESLEEAVLVPLRSEHTNVAAVIDPTRESGRGYYEHVCFKAHTSLNESETFELGDGGFTDWTQQLLSNRKERLMISGAGLERVAETLRERDR